jgi:hypothetical protein
MDIKELVDNIALISNKDELRKVNAAVKVAWDTIDQRAKLKFYVHQKVEFIHKNKLMEGVVTKINRKTIKVQVGHTLWTCNPSLLTAVETIYNV